MAVVVDKRSGASRIAKGQWRTLDIRLNTFINWHYENALPDGAAYELRDLWIRFGNITSLKKVMEADAIRILRRKDAKNKIINDLAKLIENKDISLEDLANEIIVARDFKRAFKQAGITKII